MITPKAYLHQHRDAWVLTVRQLRRAPWTHLLVVAVVAVTLALPTVFFVALHHVRGLTATWPRGNDIGIYLRSDTSVRGGEALSDKIRGWTGVAQTRYISAESALSDFARHSGLKDATVGLERNPLPASIVVTPASGASTPQALDALVSRLKGEPAVETVQYNRVWATRLEAFLVLGQRALAVIAILLALAVLLIVGNTIRLLVVQRRDEIALIQLMGGTLRYIRRPFLYLGVLLGIGGGIGAALLCLLLAVSVEGPMNILRATYDHAPVATALPASVVASLAVSGAVLGYLGARLSVGWAIRALQAP